jgi:hypothetical protein
MPKGPGWYLNELGQWVSDTTGAKVVYTDEPRAAGSSFSRANLRGDVDHPKRAPLGDDGSKGSKPSEVSNWLSSERNLLIEKIKTLPGGFAWLQKQIPSALTITALVAAIKFLQSGNKKHMEL